MFSLFELLPKTSVFNSYINFLSENPGIWVRDGLPLTPGSQIDQIHNIQMLSKVCCSLPLSKSWKFGYKLQIFNPLTSLIEGFINHRTAKSSKNKYKVEFAGTLMGNFNYSLPLISLLSLHNYDNEINLISGELYYSHPFHSPLLQNNQTTKKGMIKIFHPYVHLSNDQDQPFHLSMFGLDSLFLSSLSSFQISVCGSFSNVTSIISYLHNIYPQYGLCGGFCINSSFSKFSNQKIDISLCCKNIHSNYKYSAILKTKGDFQQGLKPNLKSSLIFAFLFPHFFNYPITLSSRFRHDFNTSSFSTEGGLSLQSSNQSFWVSISFPEPSKWKGSMGFSVILHPYINLTLGVNYNRKLSFICNVSSTPGEYFGDYNNDIGLTGSSLVKSQCIDGVCIL